METLKPKYCFFDIETTGLSPFEHQLHGIGFACDKEIPAYYAADNIPLHVLEILADPTIPKIGSNCRNFDARFLAFKGFKLSGPFYDTSFMSMLFDDRFKSHGLKQLTERLFGKDDLVQKSELDETLSRLGLKHVGLLCDLDLKDSTRPYFDLLSRYCSEDILNTRNVFFALKKKLEEQHKELAALGYKETPLRYFKNEMVPTESILFEMELSGIHIDRPLLDTVREAAVWEREEEIKKFHELAAEEISVIVNDLIEDVATTKKQEATKQKVRDNPVQYGCEFNIASPPQMARLIYEQLSCPAELVQKTKTGGYSTKEDHLKMIQAACDEGSKLSSVLEVYGDIKKYNKLISTYTGTEKTGIISLLHQKPNGENWLFPEYKQRTATGRLSVFPIQQMPRTNKNPKAAVAKRFFIPSTPDHVFIYNDLNAVEFRNAAHLSQDPMMLKMLRENIDPHVTLAAKMYRKPESEVTKVEREAGKTGNYLSLYGGQAGRLSQEFALKLRLNYTYAQCEEFIAAIRDLYAGYYAYLDSLTAQMEKHGYVIAENGRLRHTPDIKFGQFLNHKTKTFYGPYDVYLELLDHPGQRLTQKELYYRARGRYKHAQNSGFNHPNQSLGGTQMKNALQGMKEAGFVIRASIHDAIIVEVLKKDAPAAALETKRIMEACYPKLTVPLKSETKILTSFSEDDKWDGNQF